MWALSDRQLSHQNFRVFCGMLAQWEVDKIRRKVDICSLKEVRWRGATARLAEEKDSQYNSFCVGNDKGMGGVGSLLAEK